MDLVGNALFYAGGFALFVGYLWALGLVFLDNPLLGVVCLLIPLALLVALMQRWPRSWKPLACWMGGLAAFLCGVALSAPAR